MATQFDWSPLRRELREWNERGLTLPLWWRDDDAVEPTPQLTRLSELSRDLGVPVHLAIIPAHAEPGLASCLEPTGEFSALVHGWRHENHAPVGEGASEFGTPRKAAALEARQGLTRLTELFGDAVLPVFVPPWNRLSPTLLPALVNAGYRALSTFASRGRVHACPGLVQINTHIDPVDWNGTWGLSDPHRLISDLSAHLADRRTGRADALEPLGLLTHHLVHDEATWAFCAELVEELTAGPVTLFDFADPMPCP